MKKEIIQSLVNNFENYDHFAGVGQMIKIEIYL